MAKSSIKTLSNTFVWMILLLVFVGLGGYGVVNFSRSVTAIGKVGDTEVDARRFVNTLQAQIAAIGREVGQPVSMEFARQFGVDKQALQIVIGEVTVENEAANLGLSVGDEQVARLLQAQPALQGLTSGFDRTAYLAMLKNSGMTAVEYERQLRAAGARELLQRAIMGGVSMPAIYSDAAYQYLAERRSFTWAKVTEANLDAPLPGPTDEQIKEWYDSHPEAFTKPEVKKIEYIALKPEEVAKSVPVEEQTLKDEYQARIAEYVIPERRLVERLIFSSKADADAAMAELKAGTKTFEGLVADRQLTLDDVDLGEQTREELGVAGDPVYALTEPGLAGPVEIDLGAAIYRMNGILAAQETTFEDVRPDLLIELSMDRARTEIGSRIEDIENLLAGGETLEKVAVDTKMEHGVIDFVAGQSDGMAAYASFSNAATALTADNFPSVDLLEDGGIFAMQLVETVPPTLQPLPEVRDQVIEAWSADAKRQAVQARADALIEKLKAGESAASLGLTLIGEEPMTRDRFVEGLPPKALEELFKLPESGVIRVDGTEGEPLSVILTLTGILPPDPADQKLLDGKTGLAALANQQLQSDILRAWQGAAQNKAGVQFDQSLIDGLLARYN